MGCSSELMNYFRDGHNDEIAVAILGSLRSVRKSSKVCLPIQFFEENVNQECSRQTEVYNTTAMLDREVTTRDRDRECAIRLSRDIDVRYFENLKRLRDRFRAAYACNQHYCPNMRERFQQHNHKAHASSKSCGYPKPDPEINKPKPMIPSLCSRKLMSTECGSDLLCQQPIKNERCDVPQTSHSCNVNTDNFIDRYTTIREPENHPNNDCSNLPLKIFGGFKSSSCVDSSCNTDSNKYALVPTAIPHNKTFVFDKCSNTSHYENFNRDTSDSSHMSKNCQSENLSQRQCDRNRRAYKSKPCNICSNQYDKQNRKPKTNRGNACNIDTSSNNFSLNSFDSYTLSRKKSNAKSCSSKSENSIPLKCKRTRESCRQSNKNIDKCNNTKTEKTTCVDRQYSHSSCHSKNPFAVDKSCDSKSESNSSVGSRDLLGNKRNISGGYIQREVKEWIREVPMYPGLGKEAKEDNENAINNLIRSLNNLLAENGSSRYEQKVKAEIDSFLNKIPIWYPGAKRDQNSFKWSLVDRLLQKINYNNNKTAARTTCTGTNSNRKVSKDTVTDINTELKSNGDEIKKAVTNWLRSIFTKTKNKNAAGNNMSQLADFVLIRINPLLSKPVGTNNHKLILKTAIINAMNDLPINISCARNRKSQIHKFADDLANKLLNVQATCNNYYCTNNTNVATVITASTSTPYSEPASSDDKKRQAATFCPDIRKCFENACIDCHDVVIEEISVILLNYFEMTDPESKIDARNEIINLLVTFTNLSEARALDIAHVVIRTARNSIREGKINKKPQKSNNVSVFTSIEETSSLNYPLTSTPKKKRDKKPTSNVNPAEVQYMENLVNLIKAWMNTLPYNFSSIEEKYFKETIINDLAGDITDEMKLDQLLSSSDVGYKHDKKSFLKHLVYRWIFRLEIFDVEELIPQIENFLIKLEDIPVPVMIQPQQGNRQEMANIRHLFGEHPDDIFLAKGTEILEDALSVWFNEQPSNIFISNDQSFKNNKIHELVEVLENKLTNKRPPAEITRDIAQWLNGVVKDEHNPEIAELAEDLNEIVLRLPQDATLATYRDMKLKGKVEKKAYLIKSETNLLLNISRSVKNKSIDQENTMKMILSKYIEHSYDIDDPLARRAFNRLLEINLQRLNQPTRKQVYENFEKNISDDKFPPPKLIRELEYIKDISDWLKNIPVDASFNTLGNRERIDFVINLAKNMSEIEEDRVNNPDAMNYDMYMGHMILDFLGQLPFPNEYIQRENLHFMMNQLLNKVLTHREYVNERTEANESLNNSGVNEDNIGDFLEEFIRINGNDIAQDEVKLEAWAIRLIREIKKMVQSTAPPTVLSKSHIYNKLLDVPIPTDEKTDETVDLFSHELEYVKEITNWLKNLPLLPINVREEDKRIKHICELAEKMTELERKRTENNIDSKTETDFKAYVAKWILELPLDKRHEIVLPVAIQQLINRMEKVKHLETLPDSTFFQSEKTIEKTPSKVKKIKSSLFKSSKKNKEHSSSNIMTDVIEKWSNSLPIKAENEMATKDMKNDVSRKLFQKVGQLNVDPRVFNDDILYQDMIVDEIDTIFENIPRNSDLQKKRETLKHDIASAIVDAKNEIKEKTAGDTYKLNLEKTIEASIPNPVNVNNFDPGFEMYKDRLATMFILENFDHATDAFTTKYEKQLRKEIDKYFDHVKNKNAAPLSKNEIYNELYSALYKVPIPNEASVLEEVEELKTRCEIDAWFEELPMREATGLSELLEWEQILSTLAKRIHEIETTESKPDQKVFKEITKWLVKLPLQMEYKNKLDHFATKLLNTLKSTASHRKCVLNNQKAFKGKKGKAKTKWEKNGKRTKEDSQIAGPSSNSKMWTSSSQQPRRPRKQAADEIFEIIQTWCNQLPVCTKTQENAQMLKDNLIIKIMLKISELNANPEILNNDIYYNELLNEELERVIATIPATCMLDKKEAIKEQLANAIKSVKPLVIEERDNFRYRQDLNKTVDKILEKPPNLSPEREAHFIELRNDIVDDFLQYKYIENDDEGRKSYKINAQNTIAKLNSDIVKNREDKKNALKKTNQLMCELAKIPETSETNLRDEVEEIRMKKEVVDFFNTLNLPGSKKFKINHSKVSLAKKLNEIEMNGYNPINENKMKLEITRCLDKLGKEVNPTAIDAFINKLKRSELARRTPPMGKYEDKNDLPTLTTFQLPNIRSTELPDAYPQNNIRNVKNSANVHFIACGAYQTSCDDDDDDDVSTEEQEPSEQNRCRKCECKIKSKRYGRMPYCMVPMRYICEGCDGYNPVWCRMPLPGFL